MDNGKKIICPNCGASIYEKEPKCPFCDYINITGAEEKYMRDVHRTKEDMSQIPELQKEELKQTLSKKSKIILITIVVVGVIAFLLWAIGFAMEAWEESHDTYDAKAEMQWEHENYPQLDEWYEAGDYEAIYQFEKDLYWYNAENKTHHQLTNWQHYDFYMAYYNYVSARDLIERIDTGKQVVTYDVANFVYYGLWYYSREYEKDKTYTETELAVMEEYRTELLDYFTNRFGYTEAELDELQKQVSKGSYLDFLTCDEYAEENVERFQ